jgi:uncharacterized protein YyaL (SSP411 family)
MNINVHDNDVFHTEGIAGMLDDYVHLIDAIIGAYEVTGRLSYLEKAHTLMETCIMKFWDEQDGGFFDTEEDVIGIRIKSIEDIPQPSGNALAVILLLKLSFMLENAGYHEYAGKALEAFSGNGQAMGVHAGHYLSALDAYFNMLELTVNASCASDLAHTALCTFYPYKTIVYREDKDFVIPCFRKVCHVPVSTVENLQTTLNNIYRH